MKLRPFRLTCGGYAIAYFHGALATTQVYSHQLQDLQCLQSLMLLFHVNAPRIRHMPFSSFVRRQRVRLHLMVVDHLDT